MIVPTRKIFTDITIPEDCIVIAEALQKHHKDAEVYAVGGSVRDFLLGKNPTDFDLCTNLSEVEILECLRKSGISAKNKESDTFGVVFACVKNDGSETIEVAPFRTDIGISDGRRPGSVVFNVNILEDAMRRDFTINNLYYDFGYGKFGKNAVLDFNENGQGLFDIYDKVVRPVGDPMIRFIEDRFRIIRMVRFFCRFNAGLIVDFIDDSVKLAVDELKDLRNSYQLSDGKILHPISGERIQSEFIKGLSQCKGAKNYLLSYDALGLLESLFPNCLINLDSLDEIDDVKDVNVVLAWILRDDTDVEIKLNKLNYTNEISKRVKLLLDFSRIKENDSKIISLIKRKDDKIISDRCLVSPAKIKEALESNLMLSRNFSTQMSVFVKSELYKDIRSKLLHVAGKWDEDSKSWDSPPYILPHVCGNSLIEEGFSKEDIGKEILRRQYNHYLEDFRSFLS